jgi:FAD synthetase
MHKVIVFGTFDVLHPGHEHMLREAKEYGDYLVAVVARDKTVKKVKKISPKYSEKERLSNLGNLNIANKVRLGYIKDKYKILHEEKPNTVALGYDQKVFVNKLEDNIDEQAQIVRLAPYKPEMYKSSKLRDELI